jgi:FlaA1/EpsC-like NDP-sugar epimerase
MAVDILVFNLSFFLAYLIRFDFSMSNHGFNSFFPVYGKVFIYITLIKLAIFFIFKMYQTLWKYAGAEELLRVFLAAFVAQAVVIVFMAFTHFGTIPRQIYIISFMLDVFFAGIFRFSYRYARTVRHGGGFRGFIDQIKPAKFSTPDIRRVMIVGGGDAAATLIKDIKTNEFDRRKIVAIIDDKSSKQGQLLSGIKVVGGAKKIKSAARKYQVDEIIIAIPSATKKQISKIVAETGKTKAKVHILPSLIDLVNEKVTIKALRDVEIDDLLGREPAKLNTREISVYLEGKIVLVTGAGGSIGSELVRQIIRFRPRRVIGIDIDENALFELQSELNGLYQDFEFVPILASVRRNKKLKEIFQEAKPHVIFHAAAHKHVPLMEDNAGEALLNNILGTKNVIDAADEVMAEKVVVISTDKAVRPTNVMGATKRIAEMIVLEKNKNSSVSYAIVRFGNVLGSNGSVVPMFRKQISRGGPVTVTSEEVTRYFMTIPEASELVIQAGALTRGSEIFVLDMGDPIKIVDLAENIIKLSGFEPYEDIDIKIIGLRPGEKMHEELSYEREKLRQSSHEKIFVTSEIETPPSLVRALESGGETFVKAVKYNAEKKTNKEIKAWLMKIVEEGEVAAQKGDIQNDGVREKDAQNENSQNDSEQKENAEETDIQEEPQREDIQ